MAGRFALLLVAVAGLGCGDRGGGSTTDGGTACVSEAGCGGNACPDGSRQVSLDGDFACGDATCATGQLCRPQDLSRDASLWAYDCVAVPPGCPVCDCHNGRDDPARCIAPCLTPLCNGFQQVGVGGARDRILDCVQLQ
jgi:hypothetical protein